MTSATRSAIARSRGACACVTWREGRQLTRLVVRSTSIPEETLWNYLIQICQGLKYLHDKRILHRDIKPKNIFLDEHDEVKIGDMGLGRVLGPQVRWSPHGVGTTPS